MIPQSFEYFAPTSLDEALKLLGEHGEEARLLAGGHSLLPMMKLRLVAPTVLVDLGRVSDLSYIRKDKDHIAVGAMATHAEVERSDLLRKRAPLLPETAAEIGDMQVRNCGTIGGSTAHADPAADYPAALLALEAEMTLLGPEGSRSVAADDFFLDLFTSAVKQGEILTEIRFPADRPRTGSCYLKLPQPASGYAVVGVAVRLELDEQSRCRHARVGLTGVGSKAYRATEVEKALSGKPLDSKRIAAAASAAAQGVEPRSDLHASARYRAAMAVVFTRRALTEAARRAKAHS